MLIKEVKSKDSLHFRIFCHTLQIFDTPSREKYLILVDVVLNFVCFVVHVIVIYVSRKESKPIVIYLNKSSTFIFNINIYIIN